MVDQLKQSQPKTSSHCSAVVCSLLYLVFGLAWVLGGDVLLAWIAPLEWQAVIGGAKGAAFIAATALLLYLLLRSQEEGQRREMALKMAAERAALTRHYEHIVKYANDIFLLADENYRLVEANERAIEAYGYSRTELIGMSIRDLRAEAYREHLDQDLKKIVADRTVYQTVQRRKDGSSFPVEISGSVIEIEGHRYYQGIIRDISERKQAEQTLAASRQRFLALLDSIPDATWMKDAEGRILAANEAYARAIGVAVRDVVGKTDAELWPAALAAKFRAGDEKVMQTRAPIRLDEKIAIRNGERWFETINTPIFDDADKVVGTTGIARDITDRYQAQQALEESEARYRNLVELNPDAVAMVALDGTIISANPAGLSMFGVASAEQVIGQSMYRFVPDDQLDTFKRRLAELMEHGHLREIQSEYQRLDGSRFTVEVSSSLITSRSGQSPFMTAIIRDTSERKRHEAELLTANRALRVLSECNGALVRARNEAELLARICGILTTVGGHRLAWVGYLEDDALVPKQINWAGSDPPATWGPVRRAEHSEALLWTAIDRKQPMWIQDVAREPQRHWHAEMLSAGLGSLVELPLLEGDRVIGLLTVASAQANAFGDAEVKLLEELQGDLAFGIGGLRTRGARDQALQALNASETKLRNILDHTSDGIVLVGRDETILYANSTAEKLLDRPIATLVGSTLSIPLAGGMPLDLTISDGHTATVELSVAETEWQGETVRVVALHDVTERRQMEEQRQHHAQRLQLALIQTVEAMAMTVEKRDPYTAGHQARVADLAVAIGREMGLPENRLDGIRLGAMIHDIGKIYIPAEILNRPGRLGEHEIGLIRTHPQVGYDIVKDIDFVWPVKEMVAQHHERMDGSGYPHGLKGEQIALEARILAVADVVEAMASHRPYRPSLGVERGLEEVRQGKERLYDGAVVEACLRLFEEKRFAFDFDSHD